MGFGGYTRDVQAYLIELKANNNKGWFTDNRTRFDDTLVGPSLDLIEAMMPGLSALDPGLKAAAKINGSLRRIYRDTRFSKDKTPYHSHLHLIFWSGDHPNRSPAVHLVLGAEGFGFGVGHWALDSAELARYRADVASNGGKKVSAAFEAVKSTGAVIGAPALARVPPGFDREGAGTPWLRHKVVVARSENEPYPDALFDDRAVDYLLALCAKLNTLNRYIVDTVTGD